MLSVEHLPHKDVGEPSSLSEFSAPSNLLTIKCEVLGNPEDRVRFSLLLCRAELSGYAASSNPEAKSTLGPWICPVELFVVVDVFTREWPFGVLCISITQTVVQGHFFEGDIEATKTDVQSNFGVDFLMDSHREDVSLVLGPDAGLVSVPFIAEVGHQYYRAHE